MTLYRATAEGQIPMTPEEEAEFEASRQPKSFSELAVPYLNEVRATRERILARINGYLLRLINNEPPGFVDEKALCETLIAGLLDITTIPSVLAATTMPELEYAVKVEYARLVGLASEELKRAFRQVDV